MTIKSSGGNPPTNPLSFKEIATEFGAPSNNNLGAYRVSTTIGDATFPLDVGMPTGDDSISFSNFYGKRLNTVVHYSSNANTPKSARFKYNNNRGVTVIGGFKSKPGDSSGTRVIIHVSALIGSSSASRNTTALNTGSSWNSGTKLDIEIGSEGFVSGAGGNGGMGGNDGESGEGDSNKKKDATGQRGKDGSSALRISYYVENINIQSGGRIYGGGGGGGGSGGARNESENVAAGAGGGGGAGIPAGGGGQVGGDGGADVKSGHGSDGGSTYGGAGGRGGYELDSEEQGAKAGGGGGGGSFGTWGSGGLRGGASGNGEAEGDDAHDGNPGGKPGLSESTKNQRNLGIANGSGGGGGRGDAEKNEQAEGPGGDGGSPGYAIVISSGISSPTITGSTSEIKGGTTTV